MVGISDFEKSSRGGGTTGIMTESSSEPPSPVPSSPANVGIRRRRPTSTERSKMRIEVQIAAAAAAAPPWIPKDLLVKFAPAIEVGKTFVNTVGPFYVMAAKYALVAYHTLPVDVLHALMGLAMCFFGGACECSFATPA